MINVIADNDLILASADKCKNFIAEFLVILFLPSTENVSSYFGRPGSPVPVQWTRKCFRRY